MSQSDYTCEDAQAFHEVGMKLLQSGQAASKMLEELTNESPIPKASIVDMLDRRRWTEYLRSDLYLLIAEGFAVGVEAWWLKRWGVREALLWSLLANASSASV